MFTDNDSRYTDLDGDGVITYDASFADCNNDFMYTYVFSTSYTWPNGLYDHDVYRIKAPNARKAAKALRLRLMNMKYQLLEAHVIAYT